MGRERLTKQAPKHVQQDVQLKDAGCRPIRVVYAQPEQNSEVVQRRYIITNPPQPIWTTPLQETQYTKGIPIQVVYEQPEQNTEVVQRRYIITNLPPRPPWACSGYGFLIRTNNDKQQEQ